MTTVLQLLRVGVFGLVLQGSATTPAPCTGNCATLQLDSGLVKGKVRGRWCARGQVFLTGVSRPASQRHPGVVQDLVHEKAQRPLGLRCTI